MKNRHEKTEVAKTTENTVNLLDTFDQMLLADFYKTFTSVFNLGQ